MGDPTYITNGYVISWGPPYTGCVHTFQATSLAAAQGAAQSLATLFARSVVLTSQGTGTKYSYQPGSQGGTVAAPTGVGG